MAKEFPSLQWFEDEVKSRTIKIQKALTEYRSAQRLFWLFLSVFVITLLVGAGLNIICAIQNTGVEAVALFISGLFAGLCIDKFRYKNSIIKNAPAHRGSVLKALVGELSENGTIDVQKAEVCKRFIQDGYSQMQHPGTQGKQALEKVIYKIIEQLSK